ncbi:MAG: glycosyltransferase [Candidatus Methanoperedens sp.]|nr:glycosyltransferase [Candidatus Methanoperedens sp.]MCZ7396185.1 glycosyltransferase [Candidatus Methanoperedens sp.]
MNWIILILYILSFLLIWKFVGYPFLMVMISYMKKPYEKDYSYQPFVSIIVPSYNEEKVIKRRIENLLCLNYPKDKYEVIVVDSGSKDRTVELVENIITQDSDPPLKLIREKERKGKSSAINLSKNHAKGNIVLITDANSLFDKNVLMEMMPHFKNPDVGAVSGRYIVSNPNKTLTSSEMFYWEIEDIIMKGESLLDSISTVIGTISAWRKDLMDFNSLTISEDLDMTIQVRRKGYKIKYEPLASVYEPAATTYEDQIKQRKRTSTGTIQNIFKHFFFFLCPRNLYAFIVFPSHKTLTMLSPFILLGIPLMYVVVWDLEVVVIHFISTVIIFVGLLSLLLYLKSKLNKTDKVEHKSSMVSISRIMYYVLLNEYTMIFAWYDFIFKKYSILWERAESTR